MSANTEYQQQQREASEKKAESGQAKIDQQEIPNRRALGDYNAEYAL
jgi:hypothetical protein